ncbi:hypothetical protein [Shewanella surugensis]|uniref:Uncharacterized protein n=1 Tax=Shewanella surugensis TaxID=212020 RepID=A0ABT0LEP4_9GAMM|nr:hypothetical protein [Shewanella surugensis]MCL1126024.1 hypothetical protein [Shewanella surugensis]
MNTETEHIKKQQKYTRKLLKAKTKLAQCHFQASLPISDIEKVKNKQLKYKFKIIKYHSLLRQLDARPEQPQFPYLDTVLEVTTCAWTKECSSREDEPESRFEASKKQYQINSHHKYDKYLLTPQVTRSPSNDPIILNDIDSVSQHQKKRCKHCPAISQIGACRCASKQRQAS